MTKKLDKYIENKNKRKYKSQNQKLEANVKKKQQKLFLKKYLLTNQTSFSIKKVRN